MAYVPEYGMTLKRRLNGNYCFCTIFAFQNEASVNQRVINHFVEKKIDKKQIIKSNDVVDDKHLWPIFPFELISSLIFFFHIVDYSLVCSPINWCQYVKAFC